MIAPQSRTAPLPAHASRRRLGFALRLRKYGNSGRGQNQSIRNHTMVSTTRQAQVRQQLERGPAWIPVPAQPDARKSDISTLSHNHLTIKLYSQSLLHNPPHFSTPAPQFSTVSGLILHTSPQRFHTSPHVLPASQAHSFGKLCSIGSGFLKTSTPTPQLPDNQLHRRNFRSTSVNFCKPDVNHKSTDVNKKQAVCKPMSTGCIPAPTHYCYLFLFTCSLTFSSVSLRSFLQLNLNYQEHAQ